MASAKKSVVTALVSVCVSAFLIMLPLMATAIDYSGTVYAPWSYSVGCVAWRGDGGNFEASKVADIAADGTIGSAYAMAWNNVAATTSHRFCNTQTEYTSPGLTLVYDQSGCAASANATFSPLSLGGLWVGALADVANGTPYSVTGSGTRFTDFGVVGTNSYFKFDKSFTVNRSSATRCYGNVLIEVASDAVFSNTAELWIEADSTLAFSGAGTVALTSGLCMNDSSTLDISATTRPAITGNVTLAAGSTIVLPSGTSIGSAIDISVCSGTLSVGGPVNVKIGSSDPVAASLTVSNGKITLIETTSTYTATISGNTAFSAIQWQKDGAAATISDISTAILVISGSGTVTGLAQTPVGITLEGSGVTFDATSVPSIGNVDLSGVGVFLFTANYPQIVPAGVIYKYQGGVSEGNIVAIASVTVNGTLKTTGYVSLTGLTINTDGTLDVIDGNTTATAATNGYGDKLIDGNLIVRAGAILTPAQGDFLDYYNATSQAIDIYGTVAMSTNRWSIKSAANCTVNLYPGARVTGTGDQHGVFDLYKENSKLNVYSGESGGEVVIEGVVRTRNANTPIWVAANTTLKIGGLRDGGVNKSGNGTLEISGTISSPMASTVSEGTVAFVDTTVALPLTVNASKAVTASASEGVTVPLNITSMAANANITVSGEGVVNGTVVFAGKPAGTLSGLTSSTWQGTIEIAALSAEAGAGSFPLTSYGNANSKIVLKGISGTSSYFGQNANTTVDAEVQIDGNVDFNNGWGGKTYTLNKVTGGGDGITLKLATASGMTGLTYVINELDYSGVIALEGNSTKENPVFNFRLGNIVKNDAQIGQPLVKLTTSIVPETSTETININIASTTLNSATTNLCYATVAGTSGIYIAAARVGDAQFPTLQAALDARRAGTVSGSIYVLDGTAAIPEGYVIDNGRLVRRAFFIKLK